MEFRADLHCHSNCSDGTDPPLLLLEKAKEANLQGLSITDHDTISAYTPELFQRASELKILLLPGIEISSELDGHTIHVLGYGYDLASSSLQTFLKDMQERRERRNLAILEKLQEKKMPVEQEEFFSLKNRSDKVLGRPHIAELMLKKGYVNTMQQAFDLYLKEGAPCYVPGFKYTPEEVVEEIHKAYGKASLAHPHFLKKGKFLTKLLSCSFDAIECYYSLLPSWREESWIEIAREKGWMVTGGSDYHGARKPQIPLGASYVSKEIFDALSSR